MNERTEAKHTPGPWRAGYVGQHRVTGWREVDLQVDDRCFAVLSFESDETGEANARLIAAAPEMLAALRAIVVVLDGSQPIDIPGAIMVADAAIHSAEGGES